MKEELKFNKEKYLKEGGVQCPFCGSHQIVGDDLEVVGGNCYQNVQCANKECAREWTDTYTLTDVEELHYE